MTTETLDTGTTEPETGNAEPLLVLRGIGKQFGAVRALADISFDVLPGEVHALVGENGAGKSTLVGVASGALEPTAGEIELLGEVMSSADPRAFAARGIAVVRQTPDLIPDLTVAQNIFLTAEPDKAVYDDRAQRARSAELLEPWQMDIDPNSRIAELSMQQRFVVEIVKALATDPRVLMLDEPTEHLNHAEIDRLFSEIRRLKSAGVGLIYISHRLSEVRQISDRLTVLRDGKVRRTILPDELDDESIVALMAGRSQSLLMPDKRDAAAFADRAPVLRVESLDADDCDDVSFEVAPGEIVGLAGIAGSGQSAILRALAGLDRSSGRVVVHDQEIRRGSVSAARGAGIVYIPANRATEGVLLPLSVGENLAHGDLTAVSTAGIVRQGKAERAADADIAALRIRTPSDATAVERLSGGNQQKVVFARATRADPAVLLADEPTQGVDVGARADLYRALRARADAGCAVVVVSSDAIEISGLCDRVLIVERGQIERELQGAEVTEAAITTAAVMSETTKVQKEVKRAHALRRIATSNYGPSAALLLAAIVLGVVTTIINPAFLSPGSIGQILALVVPAAILAIGQAATLIVGSIDLSIGPTSALVLVVGSFFLGDKASPGGVLIGILAILAAVAAVAVVNSAMIGALRIDPFVATLVTYIAVQGVGLLLRPNPNGYFSADLESALSASAGPVPFAFFGAIVIVVVAELLLRRSRGGLRLLAAGSSPITADRLGIRSRRRQYIAFAISAGSALIAGLLLIPQVGVGDPTVGTSYSLISIAAAVLGGASVFGGRGSFVGAALGALLMVEITNTAAFLNLDSAWQQGFQGILIILGASVFARRILRRRAA